MKTKLTFIFMLAAIFSFAQLRQGGWMVGGNAAVNSFTSVSNLSSSASFQPQVGYFLSKGLMIGSTFGYSSQTSTFDSFNAGTSSKTKNERWLVAPLLRYYPTPDLAKWFIQFDATYSRSNRVLEGLDDNINLNKSLASNFGVGMNWFLSSNIALEGLLQYRLFDKETGTFTFTSPFSPPNTFSESSTRFFPLHFDVQLGIQLFLNDLKPKTFSNDLVAHYLKKGNRLWRGMVSSSFDRPSNRFQLNLSPSYTHFLSNRWAIHTGIHFNLFSNKTDADIANGGSFFENRFWNVGLNLGTDYHLPLWKTLFLVPDVGFSVQQQQFHFSSLSDPTSSFLSESEQNENGFSWSSGLGIKWFAINRFIFSTRLGMLYTKAHQVRSSSFDNSHEESDVKTLLYNWQFGVEYFLADDLIFSVRYQTRVSDTALDGEKLDFSVANPTGSGVWIGLGYLIGP